MEPIDRFADGGVGTTEHSCPSSLAGHGAQKDYMPPRAGAWFGVRLLRDHLHPQPARIDRGVGRDNQLLARNDSLTAPKSREGIKEIVVVVLATRQARLRGSVGRLVRRLDQCLALGPCPRTTSSDAPLPCRRSRPRKKLPGAPRGSIG